VPSGPLLSLIGTVFLMVAFLLMLQGRPYWLYATVLTPAIVLLESSGSTVDTVAKERLGATLIGVACTIIVMLVLTPFAPRLFGKPPAATT
jgi:K+-transporting ATPase c subunit